MLKIYGYILATCFLVSYVTAETFDNRTTPHGRNPLPVEGTGSTIKVVYGGTPARPSSATTTAHRPPTPSKPTVITPARQGLTPGQSAVTTRSRPATPVSRPPTPAQQTVGSTTSRPPTPTKSSSRRPTPTQPGNTGSSTSRKPTPVNQNVTSTSMRITPTNAPITGSTTTRITPTGSTPTTSIMTPSPTMSPSTTPEFTSPTLSLGPSSTTGSELPTSSTPLTSTTGGISTTTSNELSSSTPIQSTTSPIISTTSPVVSSSSSPVSSTSSEGPSPTSSTSLSTTSPVISSSSGASSSSSASTSSSSVSESSSSASVSSSSASSSSSPSSSTTASTSASTSTPSTSTSPSTSSSTSVPTSSTTASTPSIGSNTPTTSTSTPSSSTTTSSPSYPISTPGGPGGGPITHVQIMFCDKYRDLNLPQDPIQWTDYLTKLQLALSTFCGVGYGRIRNVYLVEDPESGNPVLQFDVIPGIGPSTTEIVLMISEEVAKGTFRLIDKNGYIYNVNCPLPKYPMYPWTDYGPCPRAPCQHNGVCRVAITGHYFCECPSGWAGPLCDQPVKPAQPDKEKDNLWLLWLLIVPLVLLGLLLLLCCFCCCHRCCAAAPQQQKVQIIEEDIYQDVPACSERGTVRSCRSACSGRPSIYAIDPVSSPMCVNDAGSTYYSALGRPFAVAFSDNTFSAVGYASNDMGIYNTCGKKMIAPSSCCGDGEIEVIMNGRRGSRCGSVCSDVASGYHSAMGNRYAVAYNDRAFNTYSSMPRVGSIRHYN